MHSFKIKNSKLKIKNCLANPSGAVMLTVVVIIIIIGLTGVAIYSLTSSSTFTQLISQNTSKAQYLAESGFRVVASEYNNAVDPKNNAFENLHGKTLTLPDNSGAFDMLLYPYWFYVDNVYTANSSTISLKMPGGTPLLDPYLASSPRISLPSSGFLKLQGKTQLASFTLAPTPASPGDGVSFTYDIGAGFPYTIQTDEEIFLVYSESYTGNPQVIGEGGDLILNGSNDVAQILPAQNGSFRVYNENNDVMDYTYCEKVVGPGTITLRDIVNQDPDPGNESVFPFTIDNSSEIYFGRNLAVFTTATSGAGTEASTKIIGEYTDVGLDGGFSTGKDTISFDEDIADFAATMIDTTPGDTSDDPIVIDTVQKTIQLGGGLTDRFGSVWYKGDSDIANCIEGNCFLGRGIRAYVEFEFDDIDSSADSTTHGDGFTFALISSAAYADGDTGEDGEYLGYAGAASGPGLTGNGLQPPKMAVEIDTFPNPGSGDACSDDSRRDDGNANHAAMVYWGEEFLGSFDAQSTSNFRVDGGGYLRIGSATPTNGDDEDWSSTQGTISFWFKRDSIRYDNTNSSGDRMWGQNDNMEMRFSNSGNDLVLDWGAPASLTTGNPFTVVGKWYFLAITWDETADILRLYWGDETTPPQIRTQVSPWSATISTIGITENLFMNSSGGDGNQNYIVNGQGTDLRYYNVARTLAQIQSDYASRLTGSEADLQSYFPLQTDLLDAGPLGITATALGTTAWSFEAPSGLGGGVSIAEATCDDNRHGAGSAPLPQNSLNTSAIDGLDGYHQVTTFNPSWLEDGASHQLRFELIRPLSPTEDGIDDAVYDYQIKVWIDCAACSTPEEEEQFKEVRSTFTVTAPQIELTVQNGNSLRLEQTIHDNLKQILFGFTQGTGGATQNITLRNFELYFLRRYPVADLASW